VRQTRLPVRREQSRSLSDGVDIPGEGEGQHVRSQAVDDRARLLAGASVRLLDRERGPGLLLPVSGERLVELAVELAGGVIGDVEDLGLSDGERREREDERSHEQEGAEGLHIQMGMR